MYLIPATSLQAWTQLYNARRAGIFLIVTCPAHKTILDIRSLATGFPQDAKCPQCGAWYTSDRLDFEFAGLRYDAAMTTGDDLTMDDVRELVGGF